MIRTDDAERVRVIQIADGIRDAATLSFDLRDILECLGSSIATYQWVALDLECVGAARLPEGSLLATDELQSFARAITQVIDGTFLAYPSPAALGMIRRDFAHFPESLAALCIVAVDSSFYEVYAKNDAQIQLLKARFRDVREQNAKWFFCANEE